MSIVLILLGLCDSWMKNNRYLYPVTITGVGCISVIYVLDQAKVPLGILGEMCHKLPFYSLGLGWVAAGLAAALFSMVLGFLTNLLSDRYNFALLGKH